MNGQLHTDEMIFSSPSASDVVGDVSDVQLELGAKLLLSSTAPSAFSYRSGWNENADGWE